MEKTSRVTSNQLPRTLGAIAVCTGFSSLLSNLFHRFFGETALQLNASRGRFSRNIAKTSFVSLFCYSSCYPCNLSLKHLLLVLLEFKLPCLDTAQSCTRIPRPLLPWLPLLSKGDGLPKTPAGQVTPSVTVTQLHPVLFKSLCFVQTH